MSWVFSSPFLDYHLEVHLEDHPIVERLLNSFYVDNVISDAAAAFSLHQVAKEVLTEGGFNLRKFCTNAVTWIEACELPGRVPALV